MGSLIFYYGVMGCSKTANALMTLYRLAGSKSKAKLIKPAIDTRDNSEDKIIVRSRVGIESTAEAFSEEVNLKEYLLRDKGLEVILIDEAQFLTEKQVEQLKDLAVFHDLRVICYGLMTDFTTKLFEGSKRLVELADRLILMESTCDCGAEATVNARFDSEGKLLTEGEQVVIGGDEIYKPLCWKCYQKLKEDVLHVDSSSNNY